MHMSVGLFTSVYMSGHHQWHSNGVWWICRLKFIGNVTGLSLMNGVTYTVSVVARNSVGASETFSGMVTASFVVQGMHD